MKASVLITAILMTIFSSCSEQSKEDKATSGAKSESKKINNDVVELSAVQVKNAGILTGLPQEMEMHTTLKVNGVIDVPPQNIVSISIPMGGYLKQASLLPGQKVKKGALLAVLEDHQFIQLQQDYLTAKNRLGFLEVDFARQKELNSTKASSDKSFQQAKSEYLNQKVMLKALGEKLQMINIDPSRLNENNISKRINIYAPIGGYVTKVNVNMGKYVNPTDILFELINPNNLHLKLTVFENDAANLNSGQKVLCWTNKNPGLKYGATIHLITPNIGEERNTELHCHLDKLPKELIPGMFMNGEIQLDKAKVWSVPEEAIVKSDNKHYLFTEVESHIYRLTPVEIGKTMNGFVEVKSDLPSGQIVTKNAYTILMKMKNSEEG
ncbi:efflux transporter periplasmic adaptor subunit [Pedobacter sp. HMWF019]|uniref:efflux RND transporter periplasmic adaptor subunit n=1 Tax=Pedobacter sp. HMWF019 TaxID=2056856 RepID=UPI000D360D5B|nr:efflux RND transporter periplasmic adaptor subunit [Pedobacter sp. HMWF019]PTS97734.1 efflux transporter periplasmic adaptor subunit [Pedobacter sp. HMWF019]